MTEIIDILPNFGTLKEYRDFLDTLVEKSADGAEIARGMSPNDKSKQEKKQVVTKEVKKNANGSSNETHYDHIDPGVEEAPAAPPPPPLEPGQQTKIGNKNPDQKFDTPKTAEVKISGETSKIDLKPRISMNKKLM